MPPPNTTHEIGTGVFDEVLGGTYAQIGEWSRACHATQGMGRYVDEEEQPVPLHQLRTASGEAIQTDLTRDVPENLAALLIVQDEKGREAAIQPNRLPMTPLPHFPMERRCHGAV